MVDAVDDVLHDAGVPGVAVQEQESLEAVREQALRRLEVHELDRLGRQRDGAGERHVIRRVAGKENRRHQHVGLLGDELGALESAQEVGADRPLQAMLLERPHGQDHHVGARQQVAHLGRGHVRQVVLDLLLMPQRIGGRGACANDTEADATHSAIATTTRTRNMRTSSFVVNGRRGYLLRTAVIVISSRAPRASSFTATVERVG